MPKREASLIVPTALAIAGAFLSFYLIGWVMLGVAAWLWRRRAQVSSSSSTA